MRHLRWPIAFCMLIACGGPQPVFDVSGIGIRELIIESDLIIEGEVVAVEYKSAENNGTGVDSDAEVDNGKMPHTFVTYRVKKLFKGEAQERTITLRFAGGRDESGDFLEVGRIPLFDVGEKDFLFVRGNTLRGCPLVSCQSGRIRIAQAQDDQDEMVYTNDGHEALLFPEAGVIADGVYKRIHEVVTHTLVDLEGEEHLLEWVDVFTGQENDSTELRESPTGVVSANLKHSQDDDNHPELVGVIGDHLSARHFGAFIEQAVELHNVVLNNSRFINADINQSFSIPSLADESYGAMNTDPVIEGPEESAADRLERQMMRDLEVPGQVVDAVLSGEQLRLLEQYRNRESLGGNQ